jgi:ribosome maturation factor RimP
VGGRAPGKKELIELLEPVLATLGYDLVDIDVRYGGDGLLRLFIDRDPPVTLADCELVSEQVGAFLDVEDPLPGRYTLEVSSPGADRRLRTAAHFERFVGDRVRLELAVAREGRRRYSGVLKGVTDDRIEVQVDDDTFVFRLGELATARLVPDA